MLNMMVRASAKSHFGICLRAGLVAAAIMLPAAAGMADDLAKPVGKILLVVKGAITNTNIEKEARFDRKLLESLGVTEIVSGSAWHPQGTVFRGVLARRLMAAVGATGKSVSAIAANDYKVTIPLSDFAKYDVLLATHIDDQELRLRTKGPIWMIYPDGVDLPPLVRQERMIWQLTEMHVE